MDCSNFADCGLCVSNKCYFFFMADSTFHCVKSTKDPLVLGLFDTKVDPGVICPPSTTPTPIPGPIHPTIIYETKPGIYGI